MEQVRKSAPIAPIALAAIAILSCALLAVMLAPATAHAKSFAKSKPSLKYTNCAYMEDGKVHLKWGKVSGAKKYQVYVSNSKGSGYKKFATTKKTKLAKKTSGYKWYKVRAVKGGSKSKFSTAYHVFAATGTAGWFTQQRYSLYGIPMGTETIFKVGVTNKSALPMYFVGGYANCTIYRVSKSQKRVLGTYRGYLYDNNLKTTSSSQYSIAPANAKTAINVGARYSLPQPSGDTCYLITSAYRPGSAGGPNLSLSTWAGGHPSGEQSATIAHPSR